MWAWSLTWKLPWLALVEVDLGDGSAGEAAVEGFLEKVMGNELLIGGVKAKAWRKLGFDVVEMVAKHRHLGEVTVRTSKTMISK